MDKQERFGIFKTNLKKGFNALFKENKRGPVKGIISLLSLIFSMAILSCAPPPQEKKTYEILWPLPPQEPKIRFVDIIRGTMDFAKKPGLLDTFFGEEHKEIFEKPYGVTVDKEGKIYLTDIGRVWVIDLKEKGVSFLGAEPGIGQLKNPVGVVTASDGRVFVTDTLADKVFIYKDGKVIGIIGREGEFMGAVGLAIDEEGGLLYVSDSRKHLINIYSLNDYSKIRTMGQRGSNKGEFNYPNFITTDKEGNLYVVDSGNFRVQVFDRQGRFIKSFGSPGDSPGSFARPKGIAIDSEGHIYVVDAAFQNFQIFDSDGNILLYVGKGGIEPGQFLLPAGIAIDREDRIYVVNQTPPSLQIFEYLGKKKKEGEHQ